MKSILAAVALVSILVPSAFADDAPSSSWAGAEYLSWRARKAPLPPLVTTGPAGLVGPAARPGVLGAPGTVVLLGDEPIRFGTSDGARLTLGTWVNGSTGIEGSVMYMDRESVGRTISAPGTVGSPALALPFFDRTLGVENTTGIALPGGFSGVATLGLSTRLRGFEINAIERKPRHHRVADTQWIAGFRHLDLDERLVFSTSSQNLVPPLDVFVTTDAFRTGNEFYGAQVGVRGTRKRRHLELGGTAKLAAGLMRQRTTIAGSLVTNDFTGFGPLQTFPAGYFALPTNTGRFKNDEFAVVTETEARLGWALTEQLTLDLRGTFLWASDVARPGDQIDRVINPSQGPGFTGIPTTALVGPARPTFVENTRSWFASGFSVGLSAKF